MLTWYVMNPELQVLLLKILACALLLQAKYAFRCTLMVEDCTCHFSISKPECHYLTMSFNYGINLQSIMEYICKVTERIKGLERIKTIQSIIGTNGISEW